MTSQFVSCPDCHSLVLDTAEERREHRAADRQDRHVIEALRRLTRTAADDAASALQLVRDLQRDLDGLDGRVREAADAPEPDLVVVNTWPEDELDDPDDYTDADHEQDEQPDDDEDDEPRRDLTPVDYFNGPTAIR